jgi:hypothetical protein
VSRGADARRPALPPRGGRSPRRRRLAGTGRGARRRRAPRLRRGGARRPPAGGRGALHSRAAAAGPDRLRRRSRRPFPALGRDRSAGRRDLRRTRRGRHAQPARPPRRREGRGKPPPRAPGAGGRHPPRRRRRGRRRRLRPAHRPDRARAGAHAGPSAHARAVRPPDRRLPGAPAPRRRSLDPEGARAHHARGDAEDLRRPRRRARPARSRGQQPQGPRLGRGAPGLGPGGAAPRRHRLHRRARAGPAREPGADPLRLARQRTGTRSPTRTSAS